MKSWICKAFGEEPVLIDCDDPIAASGQVVIDIAACGVNFADTLILQGKYQKRPTGPFAPGFEISGTIRAIGGDVAGFAVGDRVMALPDWGGYGEKIAVDAALVTRLPDVVDFNAAAAFQIAYGTSWFGLKYRANVQPGEVVLVHGAAGGVGLTAVECANGDCHRGRGGKMRHRTIAWCGFCYRLQNAKHSRPGKGNLCRDRANGGRCGL